jgi:hypothetical protein
VYLTLLAASATLAVAGAYVYWSRHLRQAHSARYQAETVNSVMKRNRGSALAGKTAPHTSATCC